MEKFFNGLDCQRFNEWLWLLWGFAAQFLFFLRFLIQWIASERRKESYIPVFFWYFSLCGGCMLLIYAIYRKDPVFIVGQSTGLIVYIRNLVLIHKKKKAADKC